MKNDSEEIASSYDKYLPYVVDNECHRLALKSRDRSGYGIIKHRGKNHYAHRFQWLKMRGAIPEGLEILHAKGCFRDCIRIEHLSVNTHQANIDQIKQDAKQFCRVGHELNRTNSYKYNGSTICKLCKAKQLVEIARHKRELKTRASSQ
ncbi:HNH endonuclease [Rhodococcus sp. 1168]|uniref:HNH endonuclease n=1 Tax=Rhodococcus sp. 1168 TaxID=2018041 RepID=UPI000B5ABF2C